MSKEKVKNYILNENGKYQVYDDNQEELEKKYYINPEDLPNEIRKALNYNPFLLTHNYNIKSQIDSIEEFYINVNDKKIELGSLLRDDSFTKKYKKKIVKKQFKQWKQEAINNLKNIVEENKNMFLNNHQERYKIIKGYQLFYLIVSFTLSMILLFDVFEFIVTNIISNIVGIATIVLSLVCFILTFIQHSKIHMFETELNNHFNEYERYLKSSKKKINKNYKKLVKYYSKGYINNHFNKDPYPIKNIYIDMKTFEKIKDNDKDIINIYKEILKENKGVNIYYHLPLILSYFLIILNGGYILIMILIHIYKLIFMKGE